MTANEAKDKSFKSQYELLTKWSEELKNANDESVGLIEAQRDAFDNAINILVTRADNLGFKLKE